MDRRVAAFVALSVLPAACAPDPNGAHLFAEHCAKCHLDPLFPRAPALEMMIGWSPDVIVAALSTGLMEQEGRDLTPQERQAVAKYISAIGPVPDQDGP